MWCVAYTHALKEFLAKSHLEQQGHQTFLPCYKKQQRNSHDGVIKPLFPRYIFIEIQHLSSLRSIRYTRGIQYILEHQNHNPKVLDADFIYTLQQQIDDSGCVELLDDNALKPGTNVMIHKGQFSGQCAQVLSQDANKRVNVLLTLLGTSTRIKVGMDQIETL